MAYGFFDPVPRSKMRKMSMDRPDTTESPYSVDAGHYQAELSFFDYGREYLSAEKTEYFNLLQTTIKMGVSDNMDFQWVFNAYTWQHSRTENQNSATLQGFDDVQLRMKINAWGNDGGDSGLGIIPYVQMPTGSELSHGFWQGGLIMPVAHSIDERWTSSGQVEVDFVYDEAKERQALQFLHSACLGYEFTDRVGGFIEYVGVSSQLGKYQASMKNGVTLAVNDNWVLDAGYRVGLNRAAESYGLFLGTSYRY